MNFSYIENSGSRVVGPGKMLVTLFCLGLTGSPITGVHVTNCTFDNVERPNVLVGIKDLTLINVRINGQVQKWNWKENS
jgi:hypothetical protein